MALARTIPKHKLSKKNFSLTLGLIYRVFLLSIPLWSQSQIRLCLVTIRVGKGKTFDMSRIAGTKVFPYPWVGKGRLFDMGCTLCGLSHSVIIFCVVMVLLFHADRWSSHHVIPPAPLWRGLAGLNSLGLRTLVTLQTLLQFVIERRSQGYCPDCCL